VDWDPGYAWDLKFDAAPAPFDKWFPAQLIELDLGQVGTERVATNVTEFHLPARLGAKSFQLTCLDNDKGVLESWLDNQVTNVMFGGGYYVATLEECLLQFNLAKLDRTKATVSIDTMWGFISSAIHVAKSSNSVLKQLMFTMSVVRVYPSADPVGAGTARQGPGLAGSTATI